MSDPYPYPWKPLGQTHGFFQPLAIHYLCSSDPMGIISVFSMLNLAPEARHQSSSRDCTWLKLSVSDRYRLVSSAKKLALIGSGIPGIAKPLRFASSLIMQACYGSAGPSMDLCISETKSTVGITPGLVSGVESRGSGV